MPKDSEFSSPVNGGSQDCRPPLGVVLEMRTAQVSRGRAAREESSAKGMAISTRKRVVSAATATCSFGFQPASAHDSENLIF